MTATTSTLNGTVREFDNDRCLGVIAGDDQRMYPFHGVSIADGARSIAVGAAVTFEVLLKLGRGEASNIRLATVG